MSKVSEGWDGDRPREVGAWVSLILPLPCLRAGGLAGQEWPHLHCHQRLWHAGEALAPLPLLHFLLTPPLPLLGVGHCSFSLLSSTAMESPTHCGLSAAVGSLTMLYCSWATATVSSADPSLPTHPGSQAEVEPQHLRTSRGKSEESLRSFSPHLRARWDHPSPLRMGRLRQ